MIKIRNDNIEDAEKIYQLIKQAFESAEHSDGNEHILAAELRNGSSLIPQLSLVAELNNQIVGCVMFSKIHINGYEEAALAPLAVLPEYQFQGIGSALVAQGHKIAKQLGYHYSIVLGDPQYYSRFGYVSASVYNIKAPFKADDKYFMALKLNEDKSNNIEGIVAYPKEFGI